MTRQLRVSIIQSHLHWLDAKANQTMFAEKMESLRGQTDLVLLPEMFSSGFTNSEDFARENDSVATLDWMVQMAAKTDAALFGSVVHKRGEHYRNRGYFVRPDGVVSRYDKVHLFRMANEQKKYQAGSERIIVDYLGWNILLSICYDLRFPVFMRNKIKAGQELEYDLLLCVANWPAVRALPWRTLLQARAMENLAYVAGVNRVGEDGNGLSYSGDSMVLDFKGEHLIDYPASQEFVHTTVLDKADLLAFRQKFPAHLDADSFDVVLR